VPSTHIGTSGWQHDPFAGRFYPDDVPQDDWLARYADTFGTVEVNNTFYQSPETDTLRAWRRRTPDGFTFAVKANQYITHFKKLKDPDEPVQNLYRNVELFQCPPNWHQNLDRLHNFLETLDDAHRHVFEFRDPTWLNEETYDALRAHDAAFCVYDFGDRSTYRVVTTDWAYVRLRTPSSTTGPTPSPTGGPTGSTCTSTSTTPRARATPPTMPSGSRPGSGITWGDEGPGAPMSRELFVSP
jgi:uncharacterized protein YecE (DUF72 family)